MPVTIHRQLPTEIAEIQAKVEELARGYGLDCFETIFEMLDYEELSMFAAFGGFPIRYPHWRFGAEYDELMKSYSYGLSKIYEMVINSDPCYAYLLSANAISDQKLVIAHVYGHCDFFKNNAWFAKTNRKMLDQMANHATRVNRYIDRIGYGPVEQFIDSCLSLENLIDPHAPFIQRKQVATLAAQDYQKRECSNLDRSEGDSTGRFQSKDYMDPFINPPEVLARHLDRKNQDETVRLLSRSFPEKPQRDVLKFLLDHAPLSDWQHDVLSIIRDEAYYFAPQGQTKIMNEGWASYWHSIMMTRHLLDDAEIIDYADHHSGTVAMSPTRLNPYKIGIELFREIENRWNKGQFGEEWDACHDQEERLRWDRQVGRGQEKIFEVRRVHNDLTFIDTFLTEDFCRRHKMFSYAYNDRNSNYEIASREFSDVKQQLLKSLTNHSRPFVYVKDGNYFNRGELYLQHDYEGVELKRDYANDTLKNLESIWGRPVHLETVINDKPMVMSWNGLHLDLKAV